jgi:recombination protein RecA
MASTNLTAIITRLKKDHETLFRDPQQSGIIERLFLSSPQLNYLFGGGFPLGRIVELHGPEGAGKTTLSIYIGGEFQKKPTQNIVAFVDFERTFETTYAHKLGLSTDSNKFLFLRPEDGEEGFTAIEELVRSGDIGLIIWDSLAATPTRSAIADEYGKANFGGTAKLMAEALRKINPLLDKYKTTLIMTNQERDNIGVMHGPDFKVSGGRAIKFYASNRSRITKIGTISAGKGDIAGIQMRVRNEKNKAGVPYRDAELTLSFETGFDVNKEYTDFLISLGIVQQGGAWYANESWGFKAKGRESIMEFLNTRPDLFEQAKNTINSMLCNETVLDENRIIPEVPEEEMDVV